MDVCEASAWHGSGVSVCLCVACAVWLRFDFHPRQYVAGILEEDDPSRSGREVMGKPLPAGSGRSFTLYLYDRERHHVSSGWLW